MTGTEAAHSKTCCTLRVISLSFLDQLLAVLGYLELRFLSVLTFGAPASLIIFSHQINFDDVSIQTRRRAEECQKWVLLNKSTVPSMDHVQ